MIDWSFIETLEGKGLLRGYVPDAEGSSSGVTVASGVDLGQMRQSVFASLPAELRAKVTPYLNLHKQDAVAALEKSPLVITQAEADILNQAVRGPIVREVGDEYEKGAGKPFAYLPDAMQTVIMSVAFQYGAIWSRCPKFWQCALRRDASGMIAELLNFGDDFPTRRRKEAAYLESHLHE